MPAASFTATPFGVGLIDLAWTGANDPDWDHYELYFLEDPIADADNTSTLYHNNLRYPSDGIALSFQTGKRVSFALYSVDAAGNKAVIKTSAVAP